MDEEAVWELIWQTKKNWWRANCRERETSLYVDYKERWRVRKPWKMEKTMGDEADMGKEIKRWRERRTWETKRGRLRVRDIPEDEREGLSPKKMHCDWSPPECEHYVTAWGRVSFWDFILICVFQSFQSGLEFLFQGLLRFFFLISVHGHISFHKAYAFLSVKGMIKAHLSHASLEKAYIF